MHKFSCSFFSIFRHDDEYRVFLLLVIPRTNASSSTKRRELDTQHPTMSSFVPLITRSARVDPSNRYPSVHCTCCTYNERKTNGYTLFRQTHLFRHQISRVKIISKDSLFSSQSLSLEVLSIISRCNRFSRIVQI